MLFAVMAYGWGNHVPIFSEGPFPAGYSPGPAPRACIAQSPRWLHYRRTDQEQDVREDQKRMEQALATLDVVMSRLYEDYALGEISKEKYKKMTADYEAEQERLKLARECNLSGEFPLKRRKTA